MDWSVFTDKELEAIVDKRFEDLPTNKLEYFVAQEKADKTGKKAEPTMSLTDTIVRQAERAATGTARIVGSLYNKAVEAMGGQSDDLSKTKFSTLAPEETDAYKEGESRVGFAERPVTSIGASIAGAVADPVNLVSGAGIASKIAPGLGAVGKAMVAGGITGAAGGALNPVYEEYDDSIVKNVLFGAGIGTAGGIVAGLLGKYASKKTPEIQPRQPSEIQGPPSAVERAASFEPKPLVDPNAIAAKNDYLLKTGETLDNAVDPLASRNFELPTPKQDPTDTKLVEEATRIASKQVDAPESTQMREAFKKLGFQEDTTPALDENYLLSKTIHGDDVAREDVFGNKLGGFSSEESAMMAMENKGLKDTHVIAKTDDGYVLRPVKTAQSVEVPAVKGQDPNKLLHTPTAETVTPTGTMRMTDPLEAKAAELGAKTGDELKAATSELETLSQDLGKSVGETMRYAASMRELVARSSRLGVKEIPISLEDRIDLWEKLIKAGELPDIC